MHSSWYRNSVSRAHQRSGWAILRVNATLSEALFPSAFKVGNVYDDIRRYMAMTATFGAKIFTRQATAVPTADVPVRWLNSLLVP